MCFDDKNNLMVFLGTGNEELKSQTLDGESWTKTPDLGIPARTVSQCAQHESRTFIWSGGCATGIVTDSNALYVIENGQTKKEKLSGEIPSARQEFAMCTGNTALITIQDFLVMHCYLFLYICAAVLPVSSLDFSIG